MTIWPRDDHTYFTRSVFTHLGLWRNLYNCSLHHFTASQSVLSLKSLKCAVWTFSSISNCLAAISRGLFLAQVWRVCGDVCGYGWAHSIARSWVPIRSLLTPMICLSVLSLLAGSKSVSAHSSDLDMMTITKKLVHP